MGSLRHERSAGDGRARGLSAAIDDVFNRGSWRDRLGAQAVGAGLHDGWVTTMGPPGMIELWWSSPTTGSAGSPSLGGPEVERLCMIAISWPSAEVSIRELFVAAD